MHTKNSRKSVIRMRKREKTKSIPKLIQKDGLLTFKPLKAKMTFASSGPTPLLLKLFQTQCSLPNAFNSASPTTSPQKPPRPPYRSHLLPIPVMVFTKFLELSLLSKLMQLARRK